MPLSSNVSRRTASSMVSPGSTNPAKCRIPPFGKMRAASHQTFVTLDSQHDNHRIRARKNLVIAIGAVAAVSADMGNRSLCRICRNNGWWNARPECCRPGQSRPHRLVHGTGIKQRAIIIQLERFRERFLVDFGRDRDPRPTPCPRSSI